jgi:hypothetical protein
LIFSIANIALCKCKEGAEERENYNKTKLKGLIKRGRDYGI